MIYASHVLEHIWWYLTILVLKSAFRVLKPKGVLEIHVPDFAKIVESYDKKVCGDSWRRNNSENEYMKWVNGRLFAYGSSDNTHRAVFDEPYLRQCLQKAEFVDIRKGAIVRGHNHGVIDLGMTAIK
jgi:predicted SAM-dependent methyltransferase